MITLGIIIKFVCCTFGLYVLIGACSFIWAMIHEEEVRAYNGMRLPLDDHDDVSWYENEILDKNKTK